MNKNREKLLTLYGIQGTANLDVQQLSQLTGVSYDALEIVYVRGAGKQADDPFSEKKKNTKRDTYQDKRLVLESLYLPHEN
jgi:hypothetical protein